MWYSADDKSPEDSSIRHSKIRQEPGDQRINRYDNSQSQRDFTEIRDSAQISRKRNNHEKKRPTKDRWMSPCAVDDALAIVEITVEERHVESCNYRRILGKEKDRRLEGKWNTARWERPAIRLASSASARWSTRAISGR